LKIILFHLLRITVSIAIAIPIKIPKVNNPKIKDKKAFM